MKVDLTQREFEVINFSDHNGIECSLQQSSATKPDLSEEPGASFVWLGCNDADPQYFVPNGNPSWRPVEMPKEYIANTRMHLSREQVIGLVTHLQAWLETGSFRV